MRSVGLLGENPSAARTEDVASLRADGRVSGGHCGSRSEAKKSYTESCQEASSGEEGSKARSNAKSREARSSPEDHEEAGSGEEDGETRRSQSDKKASDEESSGT
jgi:hypothetical protein